MIGYLDACPPQAGLKKVSLGLWGKTKWFKV
jgi:hypothetical protein